MIGDAGQEVHIRRVEIGQHQVDEVRAQGIARRPRRRRQARGAAAGHRRQRQLQSQWPAFGEVVQPRGGIVVEAVAEALVHHFQRLGQLQAAASPGRRPRSGHSRQIVDRQMAVAACRQHHAQVGRRVAQQVGQHLARVVAQPFDLVDEQHQVERAVRHLGQPQRDAFQTPLAGGDSSSVWPKPGRAAPLRTASASACTRRFGVSRACACTQATAAPRARCSSRHCASSEVLPKPAGACTSTIGWSARCASADSSRARVTRWRGTRGGVTLSSRSSAATASEGIWFIAMCLTSVTDASPARDADQRVDLPPITSRAPHCRGV